MFENPRRGRQARNFTTNAPKIVVGCPWVMKRALREVRKYLTSKPMTTEVLFQKPLRATGTELSTNVTMESLLLF